MSSTPTVVQLLREHGKLEDAKKLFTEALAVRRRLLGDRDPKTLTSINNLGLVLREEKRVWDENESSIDPSLETEAELNRPMIDR